MARVTGAARAADLTDQMLRGVPLSEDERDELAMLVAAAKAAAELPAAVRALERAQAKVVSAEAEIGRLQSLVDAPNRPSARKGVGQ